MARWRRAAALQPAPRPLATRAAAAALTAPSSHPGGGSWLRMHLNSPAPQSQLCCGAVGRQPRTGCAALLLGAAPQPSPPLLAITSTRATCPGRGPQRLPAARRLAGPWRQRAAAATALPPPRMAAAAQQPLAGRPASTASTAGAALISQRMQAVPQRTRRGEHSSSPRATSPPHHQPGLGPQYGNLSGRQPLAVWPRLAGRGHAAAAPLVCFAAVVFLCLTIQSTICPAYLCGGARAGRWRRRPVPSARRIHRSNDKPSW
jgi:hypothetical protein